MPIDLRETELLDMHGRPQHYYTIPLDADDAFDLQLEIAAAAMGPAKDIFGALTVGDEEQMPSMDKILVAVSELVRGVVEKGGSKLAARILAKTQRVIDGKRRRLAEPIVRTEAYSGGNLMEMYEAMWWVLKENYAPFMMAAARRFGLQLSGQLGESKNLEVI